MQCEKYTLHKEYRNAVNLKKIFIKIKPLNSTQTLIFLKKYYYYLVHNKCKYAI